MRAMLEWSSNYETGSQIIDQQHQEVFKRINAYFDACEMGQSKQAVTSTVDFLAQYVAEHFSTEEQFMQKYKYPDYSEHKAEHQKLRDKVMGFYQKFKEGKVDVTVELIDFLENWLVDHLENQDQKYVECFKKNGLS